MGLEDTRIIKILRDAAVVMETGGFVGGTLFDGKGAHCALGAICKAESGRDMEGGKIIEEVAAKLTDIIKDQIPEAGVVDPYHKRLVTRTSKPYILVAGWNNVIAKNTADPAKTVACHLRAAAELLEEEQTHGAE